MRQPELKIKRARGFLLIVAILVVVVVAVAIAALGYMLSADVSSSAGHQRSAQAYFAATSGLERATQQLASLTRDCASLTYTNEAVGNGTFTTSGTAYAVTAGVTVVALGANTVDSVIPVSSVANLAPHGRVRISAVTAGPPEVETGPEEINYASTSTLTSVCGGAVTACLTGARRGVAGTVATAHAAGATMLVRQDLCLIRSTGTVGNAVRILERTLHTPEKMMVSARAAADRNVYYRLFDVANDRWALTDSLATPMPGGTTANFLGLSFARTRNEAVLVSLDSGGNIRFQRWNGFAWSATTPLNAAAVTTMSTGSWSRGFDLAYETANDRAIIVYYRGNTGSPDYSIWNGTTLSASATTGMNTGGGVVNMPAWVHLASNPLAGSNEIAMLALQIISTGTGQRNVRGMVWNGAAWSNMGTNASWDTATDTNMRNAMDVAYEQNSGHAMFAWASSATDCLGVASSRYACYRTWNGTALSATARVLRAGAGTGQWVRLAPRFQSNEMMLGQQDSSSDLYTAWWSGSAWTPYARQATNVENVASRAFDLAWEGEVNSLGNAQLVWGNISGTPPNSLVYRYRWDGALWNAVGTSGDHTSLVQLSSGFAQDRVFAGLYESTASATDDITEMRWRSPAAAWSTPPAQIWNGGTYAAGGAVYERVFVQGRGIIFIDEQEIFP